MSNRCVWKYWSVCSQRSIPLFCNVRSTRNAPARYNVPRTSDRIARKSSSLPRCEVGLKRLSMFYSIEPYQSQLDPPDGSTVYVD